MDAVEQFLWDTKFEMAAAVMGNQAGEFALVDLDRALDLSTYIGRGLCFCGVLGYVDGQFSSKTEPTLEGVSTMPRAALEFAQLVVAKLKPPMSDGTEWLSKLWSLPDVRSPEN